MAIAASNAFTVEDLEALPDDGKRYELIGGAIMMSPSPEPVHQVVSVNLQVLLMKVCPPDHKVLAAPIDCDLPGGQRVVPDLVVAPRTSIGRKRIEGPALLFVEIVSPGSRIHDMVTKRVLYEEAGVPAYWIVDPATNRFLALRLVDGEYQASVDTDGPVTVDWPVAVSFRVAELAER